MKRTFYTCQQCGWQSAKWLGKCPECNSWNTLIEEIVPEQPKTRRAYFTGGESPKLLTEIEATDEIRLKTDIAELDRILGGGLVPGSVTLIGGDPGIGKSTLLLQASNRLSRKGSHVLYVSGEESTQQTKLRANRVGGASKNLYIACQTNLDVIIEHIKKLSPKVVVIDSVQVVYKPDLSSSPGSVSQVRDCAGELTFLAKSSGICIFLVGHVTKDGSIAGPRVLEHIVDTVLYFEGERYHSYRILRAVKNRFGSTNEIGLFEMSDAGLREVSNPSEIFLSERALKTSGSIVVPSLEGSRPLLVEIQALVTPTNFGLPRRRATGLDYNRVNLLLAVLEKRAGLFLANQDVFVNVAGGVKIVEPAVDLGIVISVASSLKDVPAPSRDVVFGEVGLGGEVRAVNQAEKRISEAQKLGFKRCLISKYNLKSLSKVKGLEIVGVANVAQAIEAVL